MQYVAGKSHIPHGSKYGGTVNATHPQGRLCPGPVKQTHMKIKSILTAILLVSALTAHAGSPLPVSSPEHQQIDPARLERMHTLVNGYIADGKHAGAVTMVVRNGMIVDWQTWGKANLDSDEPLRKDSIFRIYSMSKVITSAAALQLFEQNKLLLIQPATDFIPELRELRVFAGGSMEAMELEDVNTPINDRDVAQPHRRFYLWLL